MRSAALLGALLASVLLTPTGVADSGGTWHPVFADGFPSGSLNPRWETVSEGTGRAAVGGRGGLLLNSGTGYASVQTTPIAIPATTAWRLTLRFARQAFNRSGYLDVRVIESNGRVYEVQIAPSYSTVLFDPAGYEVGHTLTPGARFLRLTLKSRGGSVVARINDRLVGRESHPADSTSSLQTQVTLQGRGRRAKVAHIALDRG